MKDEMDSLFFLLAFIRRQRNELLVFSLSLTSRHSHSNCFKKLSGNTKKLHEMADVTEEVISVMVLMGECDRCGRDVGIWGGFYSLVWLELTTDGPQVVRSALPSRSSDLHSSTLLVNAQCESTLSCFKFALERDVRSYIFMSRLEFLREIKCDDGARDIVIRRIKTCTTVTVSYLVCE